MPREYFKTPLTNVGGYLGFPKPSDLKKTYPGSGVPDTENPFDPADMPRPSNIAANIPSVAAPAPAAQAAPVAPAIAARPSLPNAVGESVPDTSGAVSRLRGVDQFKDQGYNLPEQGRSGPLPKGVTLGASSFQRDPRLTDTPPEQNQAILFGRPSQASLAGNIAQGPNTQRLVTPEAIQRLTASGNMDEASARNYLLQNGFTDQATQQPAQPVPRNSNLEYSNIGQSPAKYPVGSIGGFIGALGKEAMARNAPKLALQKQAVKKGATVEGMLAKLAADPSNRELRDSYLSAIGHTPPKDSVITIAEEPIDPARPELGMRKTPYIYTPSTKEVYRLEDLAAATNKPQGVSPVPIGTKTNRPDGVYTAPDDKRVTIKGGQVVEIK